LLANITLHYRGIKIISTLVDLNSNVEAEPYVQVPLPVTVGFPPPPLRLPPMVNVPLMATLVLVTNFEVAVNFPPASTVIAPVCVKFVFIVI
jgi:hypothetical protein